MDAKIMDGPMGIGEELRVNSNMPKSLHEDFIQLGPSQFNKLHLPPFRIRWKSSDDGTSVLAHCLSRKKWVTLDPEEWVRQHWLHYLSTALHYPLGLMKVELPLELNGMNRYADIVCHDDQGSPLLLLELKRPSVQLSQSTLDQVLRYQLTIHAPWICISNGIQHRGYHFDNGKFETVREIPSFNQAQKN